MADCALHLEMTTTLAVLALVVLGLVSGMSTDKVNIELYYESQCPGCKAMITKQIAPAIVEDGIAEILNLTLIPYGNAKMSESGQVSCQHGPQECIGNKWSACVIDTLVETSKWLPVITCIEKSGRNFEQLVPDCLSASGIDSTIISECATSSAGDRLIAHNAKLTSELVPAHHYVPWIVVNGQHTDEIQTASDDMVKLICDTYTGSRVPSVCHEYRRCYA